MSSRRMYIVFLALAVLLIIGSFAVVTYKGEEEEENIAKSKLSFDLFEQLKHMADDQPISFGVWLDVPDEFNIPLYENISDYFNIPINQLFKDYEAPTETDKAIGEEIEGFLEQNYYNKIEIIRNVNGLFKETLEFLKEGYPDMNYYMSETLPLIIISGTKELIFELLQYDEVVKIYSIPTFELALNTVRKVVGLPDGFNGDGVKIAVIEVLNKLVLTPDLIKGKYPITVVKGATGIDAHHTWVVSIIRSTDNKLKGLAPDVRLWTTSIWDEKEKFDVVNIYNEFQQAIDSAMTWGARGLNLSICSVIDFFQKTKLLYLDLTSRICDFLICHYGLSIIVAAGNMSNDQQMRVTNPAIAYNVIAVGNYKFVKEKNIPGVANLTPGDKRVIDHHSNSKDPYSKNLDRNKPEVAAPGTNIDVPSDTHLISGTSYSAPVVTGEVAILMEISPWLQLFPQAVKAIIMAFAIDYVFPASVTMASKDCAGAGGVRIDEAINIVKKKSGTWGLMGMQKPKGNYQPSLTKVVDLGQGCNSLVNCSFCF